jgi:outer membrane protein assembly factor BamB
MSATSPCTLLLAAVVLLSAPSSITEHRALAQENADPWPMWQRTASRLGRTTTIGPRTPTLAWKLRIDPLDLDTDLNSSAVLDAQGRLFVGVRRQVTCVDTISRTVLWGFPTYLKVNGTPALWEGRVLFGTTSGDEHTFYCVNAETGEEIWNFFVGPELITSSPVVEDGVVYFNAGPVIYARRVEDGSEVWTRDMGAGIHTSPSLEPRRQLFGGSDTFVKYFAFELADGATRWEFPLDGFPEGTAPVEEGRLYLGTRGGPSNRLVYCIGTETGSEIWRFEDSPRDIQGAVALGQPGLRRVYALATVDWLFCLDGDDGSEVWRHYHGTGLTKFAPIVDGSETIYFGVAVIPSQCSVRAVRPDGTELWRYPMPESVFPSPVLAPDGTLYVICSDKYLYAFHDPPNPDQADPGDQTQPTKVRPLPRP